MQATLRAMESLIIVAKRPQPGAVLTEIAERHGADKATRLYIAFMQDLACVASAFRNSPLPSDANRKALLLVDEGTDDPVVDEVARLAGGRALGVESAHWSGRMIAGMRNEFDRGARSVVALLTEAPTVPPHLVDHAFRALLFHDVVVGPTCDGQIYLVGACRPLPGLFEQVDWTSPELLAAILAAAGRSTSLHLLPYWYRVCQASHLRPLRTYLAYLRGRESASSIATAEA
ncbi:MAG: DUF2064 domain-containing protein, partial [Deltaproteobacteria bacterium]|nr:DUF2064 domain-containing protein [Deltaproteobacteria bacterium]